MLQHVFLFGVILPTVITIIVFVSFLICWFKCNMKERLMNHKFWKKTVKQTAVVHSNPSAIKYQENNMHSTQNPSDQNQQNQNKDDGGHLGNQTKSPRSHSLPRSHSSHGPHLDRIEDSISTDDAGLSICRKFGHEKTGYTNPNMCVNISTIEASPQHHRANAHYAMHCSPQRFRHNHWGSIGGSNSNSMNSLNMCDQTPLVQQTFHFSGSDPQMRDSPNIDSDPGSDDSGANYAHFVPISHVVEDENQINTSQKSPTRCPPQKDPHPPSQFTQYSHGSCNGFNQRCSPSHTQTDLKLTSNKNGRMITGM